MTIEKKALEGERDDLGCSVAKLGESRDVFGGFIKFSRKQSASFSVGRVETSASHRGVLIGMSAKTNHQREIFRGRSFVRQEFGQSTFYIRDFDEDYKADLSGSFDFQLMEISKGRLERLGESVGIADVQELNRGLYENDPVLAGLLGAIFSASSDRKECSALFVDQISLAIGAHLLQNYGTRSLTTMDRHFRLAARHLSSVTEMIDCNLDGKISVPELALLCDGMPSALFLRAFRETTGQTPHQWLIKRRIEKARDLLLTTNLTLETIAGQCGFADQSHFTRNFTRKVGQAPATWRRRQRN